VVRGAFVALTEQQRATLLSQAARHDVLVAEFTPEGHLTYDIAARPFFTFRFLDAGEGEEDLAEAVVRAEQSARAWLDARGYAYKNLKSQGEDLSRAPLAKRQRRQPAGDGG
jgi:hypothetical protein